MENKTGKYLKYAIGEIVLVVIGILIALSINNWNEDRNKENRLDNIYYVISENLRNDLEGITEAIIFYEEREVRLDTILTTKYPKSFLDSINETNYKDCVPCRNYITNYRAFAFQDDGVELLKRYNENRIGEIDSLSQKVIKLYTVNGNGLNRIFDIVQQEALLNLKYTEQFSWYLDYSQNIYNPEAILFFTQNQIYKNKVSTFKTLAIGNYLRYLRAYRKEASNLLNTIEKRHDNK